MDFNNALAEFARLISDHSSQLKRLGEMRSLHQQWYRYAQPLIALRQQEGDYQSYIINVQGKKLIDQLRGEMASFIQTEELLRNTRTVQQTTQWLLISRIPLFLGIGVFLAFFIRRQLMAVALLYGRALKAAKEHTEVLRESDRTSPKLQVVEDGEAAVRYLSGEDPYGDRLRYPLPVLVLLDLKLPRKSGAEVLAWVRQQPEIKRLPIVVLTSSQEYAYVNNVYDLGANAYLVKPVAFDNLVDIVKTLNMHWIIFNEKPELRRI